MQKILDMNSPQLRYSEVPLYFYGVKTKKGIFTNALSIVNLIQIYYGAVIENKHKYFLISFFNKSGCDFSVYITQ